MDLQLERIGFGTDHVQIFRPLRRTEEITYSQRRIVSIQKHVSIGKLNFKTYQEHS